MNVLAVIVAAGKAERFGQRPKQYAELAGASLLARATLPFQHCPAIQKVAWVVPRGDEDRLGRALPASLRKVTSIVAGGETRRDSVAAALALDIPSDIVLVHDAARPLVTRALIERVLAAAIEHGAAVPVVTPRDTVKLIAEGKVAQTMDRDRLRLAQTPQGFRTDLLRRAHKQVPGIVSDDAELVERIGHPVVMVPGDESNLKVTTPSDLIVCEALWKTGHGESEE